MDVQAQATRSHICRCSTLHDSLPWTVQSADSLLPETTCLLYKVLQEGGCGSHAYLPFFICSWAKSFLSLKGGTFILQLRVYVQWKVWEEKEKQYSTAKQDTSRDGKQPYASYTCLLLFQGARSCRKGFTQAGDTWQGRSCARQHLGRDRTTWLSLALIP